MLLTQPPANILKKSSYVKMPFFVWCILPDLVSASEAPPSAHEISHIFCTLFSQASQFAVRFSLHPSVCQIPMNFRRSDVTPFTCIISVLDDIQFAAGHSQRGRVNQWDGGAEKTLKESGVSNSAVSQWPPDQKHHLQLRWRWNDLFMCGKIQAHSFSRHK